MTYMQSVSTNFEVVEDTTHADGKSTADAKPSENAGSGLTLETLLSDREMRDLLLNDLVEAESFIKRRLQELKGTEQATFSTYEETGKSPLVRDCDNIEFLTASLQDMQKTYETLTTKRLYTLLNLKHNPTYSRATVTR